MSYRAGGFLSLCAALLGAASGENGERVSSGPFLRRGDDQLQLVRARSTVDRAGLRTGALQRVNAAVVAGEEEVGQPPLHSPPQQRRRTQSSCEESTPFAITSSYSSAAEGCYFQTTVPVGDGYYEVIYTPSGEPDVGQMWMHPDGIVGYSGVSA